MFYRKRIEVLEAQVTAYRAVFLGMTAALETEARGIFLATLDETLAIWSNNPETPNETVAELATLIKLLRDTEKLAVEYGV